MTSPFSTKFVHLLRTWDEAELKAFDAWLRSPWCNSNKNLIRLFARLRKYYPDFENEKLTKEKLFRQVLPDGKFSDRRMNNLLSEGYLAAEKFLAFQRLERDPGLQNRLLAEELQERSLDDWFFKNTRREIDRLERKELKDWEDHLALFSLYRRSYHHPSQETRMRPGAATIVKMGSQLDLLYLLEKAALINEKMARGRLLQNERHEIDAELKSWQAAAEGIHHPAIELYRMRFAYTEESRLDQYRALRAAFLERIDRLNEKEQKLHLLSLLNDTMLLIKTGVFDITESLPLYRLGLETGVLLHQGRISRNTYTTVVIAGNTQGAFGFTEQFMKSYTPRLHEKIREDCHRWAKAHTAYWRKDLEACVSILQRHNFQDPYFQLISRVLHTQAYFDLYLQDDSYLDYVFHYFDTFEKWLNREKVLSRAGKTSFLRFVQKCKALARHYAQADFDPQKVETLLENERNIQALNWLNRKREEVLRLRG